MNLAIVLIHNKSDAENEAQIEALHKLLEEHTVSVTVENEGQEIIKSVFSHYTLKGVEIDHQVSVYQIVPFQPDNKSEPYEAVRPANMGLLNSHNVYYGKGDEDKVGDHPRFFNWGLKRSVDYEADVTIHVSEVKDLVVEDLPFKLSTLIDKSDPTEFLDETSVKYSTKKLLEEVGQLNESKGTEAALTDYKAEIENKGLIHG